MDQEFGTMDRTDPCPSGRGYNGRSVVVWLYNEGHRMQDDLTSLSHTYRSFRCLIDLYEIDFDLAYAFRFIAALGPLVEDDSNTSDLNELVKTIAALAQMNYLNNPFDKYSVLQEVSVYFSRSLDMLDSELIDEYVQDDPDDIMSMPAKLIFDEKLQNLISEFVAVDRNAGGDCEKLKALILSHPGVELDQKG